MHQQKLNELDVKHIIKSTLTRFYFLARISVRTKKYASPDKRKQAEMALLRMKAVAFESEKWFARSYTESAWCERAGKDAKSFVDCYSNSDASTPEEIAVIGSKGILDKNLYNLYYKFCENTRKWEYARTVADYETRDSALEQMVIISNKIENWMTDSNSKKSDTRIVHTISNTQER